VAVATEYRSRLVMWRSKISSRPWDGAFCAQRHITTATTFRILCGAPHNMRGNPHVRFDERGVETERKLYAQATAPFLDFTKLALRGF
jgi:hypothetical protein